ADHAFLTVEQRLPPSADRRLNVNHRCAARASVGGRWVVQEHRFTTADAGQWGSPIRLRFRGRLALPALAMITETGIPTAATAARTVVEADGAALRLDAPELPATAAIDVDGAQGAVWQLEGDGAELLLLWPAGQSTLRFHVSCALWPAGSAEREADVARRAKPPDHRRVAMRVTSPAIEPASLVVPPPLRGHLQRFRRRALRYVTGCTALSVSPRRVAILTDHRILPLSWTRDAYYQALLLLGDGRADLVADHLRWLWLSCDRPRAAWARSHHADGRRKDEVYQADQQLYPVLELADHWRATGRLPELPEAGRDGPTWKSLVSGLLDALVGSFSPAGLLATDENAADDPAIHPYLLSTQILAWHAFSRLAEMSGLLGIAHPLGEMAERSRRCVNQLFRADRPTGAVWAYAVDARGGMLLHHDANDLPTAFAPLWGFCAPDDPLWRRTMDFAFSPANDAYVVGPWGGLGSRHTAGTWSLGLIQEWVARSVAGDAMAAADALRRLVEVSLSDGTLPEASDPKTGHLLARPWFAWPGALAGWLSAGG
ncbi:MAG: glycoside hydrolase family 125 protein, partial [Chloroflexota bacterium]|nr:glycoside hydrolase family 125 protein [Chloroflexota bacterium]